MTICRSLTRTFLVISLVYLASCTKSDLSQGESLTLATSENATIDLSGCKLRRIWIDYSSGTHNATGLFTYSKGNPISLIFNINGTGNPNHYWFYDKQNRLVEWRKTYQNGSIVSERHRYVYNAAGVAIRDTAMFIEGDTITNVHTFTYDNQGRIVKENIKNISSPGVPQRNPTYTYDARGNLATVGWKSSWYDNKVNPLRTHPVFQFISKNWSQNNASPQAKYNSKGLPLSVLSNNDIYFNSMILRSITYDCQ